MHEGDRLRLAEPPYVYEAMVGERDLFMAEGIDGAGGTTMVAVRDLVVIESDCAGICCLLRSERILAIKKQKC